MLRKLTRVETYDHPLVFVLFLALMMIPVLVALYTLSKKVGLNIPGISVNQG